MPTVAVSCRLEKKEGICAPECIFHNSRKLNDYTIIKNTLVTSKQKIEAPILKLIVLKYHIQNPMLLLF